MSKEEKEVTPAELLSEIIAKEAEKDAITVVIDEKRKKLDAMMIAAGVTRLATADELFEALRYPSTNYDYDEVAMVTALSRFEDKTLLDKYMPRSVAKAKTRELLDSKERKDKSIQRLRVAVRRCCTKHSGWTMKVQKAKKKSKREAVGV